MWWAATGTGHSPEGWGSRPLLPLPWTEAEDRPTRGAPVQAALSCSFRKTQGREGAPTGHFAWRSVGSWSFGEIHPTGRTDPKNRTSV